MTVFCYNFWRRIQLTKDPVNRKNHHQRIIKKKTSNRHLSRFDMDSSVVVYWSYKKMELQSYAVGELIKTCHQQMDQDVPKTTNGFQMPTGFRITLPETNMAPKNGWLED